MVDVVCLGESLAVFRPAAPGQRLAEAESFRWGAGGAESNVACALAAAGHRTRWVSRLGRDGFGDRVLAAVAGAGVDVSAVRRDPGRPTGVYFRTDGDRGSGGMEAAYYRSGSAASAMSPESVPAADCADGRVLHLTGITAALSPGCRRLLHRLTAPAPHRPLISFDVNHRPQLWRGRDAAGPLRELARRCDLVFTGADEAAALWGATGGPGAVRAVLPEPAVVVVKQGPGAAVAVHRDGGSIRVPAPGVRVVAAVGAGDAFAAGYLSAHLRGLAPATRLRHGHLFAAAALTDPGDHAPPPPRPLADELAALPDDAWAALRLAPGWAARGDDRPATGRGAP